MLQNVGKSVEELTRNAEGVDREINRRRLLRGVIGRIEARGEGADVFVGDSRTARFTSWCDVPAGWQERCAVELRFVTVNGANALVLSSSTDRIVIREGFTSGGIRYLADAGHGGSWLESWSSRITTPVAIGVVIDADTLIIRLGERG
jgi:hypothetical protein